jgi:hypothetical protein
MWWKTMETGGFGEVLYEERVSIFRVAGCNALWHSAFCPGNRVSGIRLPTGDQAIGNGNHLPIGFF